MPTRKLGFSPLFKAVYTLINGGTLTSSYTVYNNVPKNARRPYVVIKNPIGVPSPSFDNRDSAFEANSFYVDVFGDDDNLGDKQVAEMMNNIIQEIDENDLSIDGYSTPPLVRLEYANIVRDEVEDGKITYHGITRWVVHMNPTA